MIALDVLRVDSLASYLIAVLAPALDAILPVVPSETAVITLGVATAGSADPRIALLVACSAAGAFLGDNLCYLLGRRFGPWIERRFFASEKGARRRDWAEHSLERYGMPLIIVCRFIPGGRTAVMLSCGIVGYQRRRFVIATAIAGVIWACYSFFIGRLGGKAFEDKPWAGLLLALGLTVTISAIIEAVRRIRSRRARSDRSDRGQDAAEPDDATPEHHGAAAYRHDTMPGQRNTAREQRDSGLECRDASRQQPDPAAGRDDALAEQSHAAEQRDATPTSRLGRDLSPTAKPPGPASPDPSLATDKIQ